MSKYPDASIPTLDAWAKAAAKAAPGGDVSKLNWVTPEGLTVKPLYTQADTADLPYADTLPGFEPFLRGPQPTMYAARPWTIRQYAGFSTAEASNAFYRKALAAGAQGVARLDDRLELGSGEVSMRRGTGPAPANAALAHGGSGARSGALR